MPKVLTALTSLAVGAGSIYLYHAQPFLFPLPSSPLHASKIPVTYDIPEHLLSSKTLAVVNSAKYVEMRDTRRLTVRVPKGTSNEELLARFTQGFFGGWVFMPESIVLKAVGWDLVKYKALEGVPSSTQIWSQGTISSTSLPPVQATLFGVFRLIDSVIQPSHTSAPTPHSHSTSTPSPPPRSGVSSSHSYVDYISGSETGFFAGVHRFSVFREMNNVDAGDEDKVTVELASAGHSPNADAYFRSRPMAMLHFCYAKVLFREAMAGVMQTGR